MSSCLITEKKTFFSPTIPSSLLAQIRCPPNLRFQTRGESFKILDPNIANKHE